jgi:2-polyprenyl-3-methyl-5-hydroxy-6-metoxy-1,4-benzoquinol methylase
VVTSFETIEHHDRHEEMLREIKRVLRPGGLLILSSPNRQVYSMSPATTTLSTSGTLLDDLHALLRWHFRHVRIVGQKTHTASFVFNLESPAAACFDVMIDSAGENPVTCGRRCTSSRSPPMTRRRFLPVRC